MRFSKFLMGMYIFLIFFSSQIMAVSIPEDPLTIWGRIDPPYACDHDTITINIGSYEKEISYSYADSKCYYSFSIEKDRVDDNVLEMIIGNEKDNSEISDDTTQEIDFRFDDLEDINPDFIELDYDIDKESRFLSEIDYNMTHDEKMDRSITTIEHISKDESEDQKISEDGQKESSKGRIIPKSLEVSKDRETEIVKSNSEENSKDSFFKDFSSYKSYEIPLLISGIVMSLIAILFLLSILINSRKGGRD